MLMGLVILVNVFLIIYETDEQAKCYPDYSDTHCPYETTGIVWLQTLNYLFLVLYTFEAGLRLYVERLGYFNTIWNNLDFTVVFFGWLEPIITTWIDLGFDVDVAFLRIFRICRLSRIVRIFVVLPELRLLMNGFWSSIKAIFFGSIMLFAVLAVLIRRTLQARSPRNAPL